MAHLLIRNEILDDRTVPLDQPVVVLGRGQDAQVRIDAPSISRFHARFERSPSGWVLTDLDSSNGTLVNGVRIVAATPLSEGDEIRFGNIVARFCGEVPRGPVAASAPSRQGLLWLGVALLVTAVSGTAIYRLLTTPEPTLPHVSIPSGTGTASETAPVDDGPPHPLGGDPTAKREAEIPPAPGAPAGDAEPPARPATTTTTVPPPARDPPIVVVLENGARIIGHVLDASDPIALHVNTEERLVAIPRETIRSLAGEPYAPDLPKIFDARLRRAGTVDDMLEVCRWCAGVGLSKQRKDVARIIVEGDRDHPEANAILGRFLYRGAWNTAEELKSAGVLSTAGRLAGSLEDVQRIRHLFLVAVERTPLPQEFSDALARPHEEALDALLLSSEPWRAWLSALVLRFLGPTGGLALAPRIDELAEELVGDSADFKDAILSIALSDAVRVQYPTPYTFVRRVLVVFIGEQALEDADLLSNAERMASGERAVVFGARGSTREEFVSIVANEPAFFRWQVRHEGERLLGRPPEGRDLTRGAMRLAADPATFKDIRSDWLRKEIAAPPTARRIKTDGQLLRGLWVDGFARLPTPEEEESLRRAAMALDGPVSLRRLLCGLVARSADLQVPSLVDSEPNDWCRRQVHRLLGRDATEEELSVLMGLLQDERRGPAAVIGALLRHPDYGTY
jgi:hypothetical protein